MKEKNAEIKDLDEGGMKEKNAEIKDLDEDENTNIECRICLVKFQSLLLSVYYVGCFISQVPGGWLAHRFGGKRLVTVTILLSAVLTLLTPVLIRANAYIVLAVRFLMGLCSGGVLPAWFDLVGVWVPPFERSRFTAFCWIGQVSGAILAYATSGVLCAHAPDNGWPFIFYVHGGATVVFIVGWQLIVADRPVKHRRISEAELSYINKFILNKTKEESRDVPWKSILTSRCLWAIYISHICDTWTFFTLLICLPMFLNDVMKLDIQKNGLYSSLPYVALAISLFLSGHIADLLTAKRILTTTATRRTFQAIAFSGAAVFICLSGFVTCSQRDLVILYICLCNFFVGMGEASGYNPNVVDIAPKYAAIIFSVSNTMAQISGFVAPTIVGALTPNGTSEEWRNVFYICAALNILGIIVFSSMSTGEVQPWSKTTVELIISPGMKDIESQTKHDQNCDISNDFKDKDSVEDILIEKKLYQ